ncbi:MAG TPA: chemotaxis protein CheW [Polyangiales bacterium]|nr:chemotaxis protein CheW [Polyangiales bacterium]
MHATQYLTFRIDQEVYGIEVGNAREVIEVSALTPMPKAPAWIRGVVNLRGSVLPVIDLRRKFEIGETVLGKRASVVVVELPLDEGTLQVGVLVDCALEVFEYPQAQIEPPPKFGARFSRSYLRGVGRRDKYLFFILEAAKVFSDADATMSDDAEESTGESAHG